jgi:hypothetical protein
MAMTPQTRDTDTGRLMPIHGMTGTPEHRAWLDMRKRCVNPRNKKFKHYGGRGIRVCERWDSFANFYADLGPRPSPLHSLDRIDNDGNYESGNCRWATRSEQRRNQRPVCRGHALQRVRTVCRLGLHPWIPENIATNGSGLMCRPCRRIASKAYRARMRIE